MTEAKIEELKEFLKDILKEIVWVKFSMGDNDFYKHDLELILLDKKIVGSGGTLILLNDIVDYKILKYKSSINGVNVKSLSMYYKNEKSSVRIVTQV